MTWWERIAGARGSYLLLIPSFALASVFLYFPAFSGIYHAFTHWQAVGDATFVGLQNFREMTGDPFLRHGVVNQLILFLADLVKSMSFPFLAAALIYHLRPGRERYWLRTAFILPIVTPGMVLVLMWYFIYDPNLGLLNQALEAGCLPGLKRPWLGDPDVALGSIIAMGFPWITSLAFLIFLAGFNDLPVSVLDSAAIDGATPLKRLWRVEIPMLIPQIRLVVLLTLITSFQDFGRILVMTSGGPGFATYVPGLWMYEQTFQASRFGYASAIGLGLFVTILSGTLLVLRFVRSDVED